MPTAKGYHRDDEPSHTQLEALGYFPATEAPG